MYRRKKKLTMLASSAKLVQLRLSDIQVYLGLFDPEETMQVESDEQWNGKRISLWLILQPDQG